MNKRRILTITMLFLCYAFLKAQDITMDLGSLNHQGVYDTKPLKKFTKINWKTELNGIGKANLILKDSILYVSSMIGTYKDISRLSFVYAINSINGDIIWQDSLNENVSAPILKDSLLYYGSDEKAGKMRALRKNDGKLIWEFPLDIASCWPPAVVDDKAFFGDHHGNWYVLNNITGEQLYKQNVKAGICCVPSVVGSMIYYMDLRGALHLFNSDTFADSIIYKIDQGTNNSPVIVDNVAYILNKTGVIHAIDIKSKKQLWSFKIDDTMFRSPAISNDVATIITTHGHIYALNINNGRVLWSDYKDGLGYTNTIIVKDIVYVGCADNYLYAFDLNSGKELWKFKSESPVNTPLVNNGIVYFTSGTYLYSIQ